MSLEQRDRIIVRGRRVEHLDSLEFRRLAAANRWPNPFRCSNCQETHNLRDVSAIVDDKLVCNLRRCLAFLRSSYPLPKVPT